MADRIYQIKTNKAIPQEQDAPYILKMTCI